MPTRRVALSLACATAFVVSAEMSGLARLQEGDPFSFFSPVVTIDPSERERIDRGEVFARALPARDGEVAVFAASRFEAEPEALVRWTKAIEALKRGPFVVAIRRFSNPPVLSDLDALVLDDVDLEGIRRCETGNCSVKLAAHEITALKSAAQGGGEWKSAVQREFRRLLLARVTKYQSEGLAGLPPYADRSEPTRPQAEFAGILARSPHLRNYLPAVADGLSDYPGELPSAESFLYWSKEQYKNGKPIIAVTQVHIVRPVGASLPAVVVLGQEVFASHYRDGSLGTTFVLDGGKTRYLVYLNRSRLDRLGGGMLSGLKRTLVERRLASEVKSGLDTARRRIESGNPS